MLDLASFFSEAFTWLAAEWSRTLAELSTASGWIGLSMLIMIELVLVVDNAVVILMECESLPPPSRRRMERYGLFQGAMIRVIGLVFLGVLASLNSPIAWIQGAIGWELSVGDLIRIAGGLFLVGLAVTHISGFGMHAKHKRHDFKSVWRMIPYLLLINIVFSADSVLSAVGTVKVIGVMILAVLISVVVLLSAVGPLSRLIASHPRVKLFAMTLVFLIGFVLVYEGVIGHFEKAILYSIMFYGMVFTAVLTWKRDQLAVQSARCNECGSELVCPHCGDEVTAEDIKDHDSGRRI